MFHVFMVVAGTLERRELFTCTALAEAEVAIHHMEMAFQKGRRIPGYEACEIFAFDNEKKELWTYDDNWHRLSEYEEAYLNEDL